MITAFMSAALLARRAAHGVPPEHRWPPRSSDSTSPGRPVTHATTSATSATGESLGGQEKGGQSEHQRERAGLADPLHVEPLHAEHREHHERRADDDLTHEDGDAEPRGHRAVDQIAPTQTMNTSRSAVGSSTLPSSET